MRGVITFFDPIEQQVENDAADDEPPIVTFVVDDVRVPFAEHVVRSLVHGMRMIVRSHIHRQFIHSRQVEMRFAENVVGCFPEEQQCAFQQIAVFSAGNAHTANVKWEGAEKLARIRLHLAAVFQYRQRPVSEIIVQIIDHAGGNSRSVVPRPSLRQHRFTHPRHKQRLIQIILIEMGQ